MSFQYFSKKFLEDIGPFSTLHDLAWGVPCFEITPAIFWRTLVLFVGPLIPLSFELLVMSALGFKARVASLGCMLHRLLTIDSSDSPLVRHLLTS